MNREERQAWKTAMAQTEALDVRVFAARAYARKLLVEAWTETWTSPGGVDYRKNARTRTTDTDRSEIALRVLADYVLPGYSTPSALRFELLEEAIALGDLLRDGHRVYAPRDRGNLAGLKVR